MLISTTNGSLCFTIFYSLAFFLTFLMLLCEGHQRKIPIISWMLLLIFSKISFIIGTKIFTFSREEWLLFRKTHHPSLERPIRGKYGAPLLSLQIRINRGK